MDSFDEAHDALVDHRRSNIVPAETPEDRQQHILLDVIDKVANNGQYFLCTLPQRSFDDKMAIARLLTSKENDIEKILSPNAIEVKDFILSKASFTDIDGEKVITPKLVLVSPDGGCVSILAKVFVSEFLLLCSSFGLPPWERPIRIGAKQQAGHGTNRYYSLWIP